MQAILDRCAVLVFIQLVAIWPVINWYMMRIQDKSDEPYGLLSLATIILFLLYKKNNAKPKLSCIYVPASILLVYCLTYHFLPPLMRAAIAAISIGCMISACRLGEPFHAGVCGLLLLSLPIISSIQFFLGYPMRIVAGEAGALLLQMSGYSVIREGTMLNWCGHLISIDAPCSGVKMLWAGLYLALTLSCFYDLKPLKSILVVLSAIIAIMIGNIFRATSLFYTEAGIINLPSWCHTMLGIIIFVLTSIAIVWIIRTIGRESCVRSFSS